MQASCGQLQGLAESTQNSTLLPVEPEEAEAELEQALELPSESAAELGSVGESEPGEKPTMAQLQDKLNSPQFAALTRMMVKANPGWGYRIEDKMIWSYLSLEFHHSYICDRSWITKSRLLEYSD